MVIVLVSGYFNPVRSGHVRLVKAARRLGDRLVVMLNNGVQQLKQGKIIMHQAVRMEVVGALRAVDEVVLSVDEDHTVVRTLKQIALKWRDHHLNSTNGGDRANTELVPDASICEQ